MSCIVLNCIRANGNSCTMKCMFISLSTPTTCLDGLPCDPPPSTLPCKMVFAWFLSLSTHLLGVIMCACNRALDDTLAKGVTTFPSRIGKHTDVRFQCILFKTATYFSAIQRQLIVGNSLQFTGKKKTCCISNKFT